MLAIATFVICFVVGTGPLALIACTFVVSPGRRCKDGAAGAMADERLDGNRDEMWVRS
ncbi:MULTISPECIES: hypothetical protein [Acidiphilium]|uniref:hypothetical protein n=1 Tax=Acidiphilium TaxID=522 RepID=UPI00257A1F7F|nr:MULTISPECIES: hypothetical protein [Acidiphilium]HQT86737.1 hypothetical protein [Acidiphilium rubrum]